MPQAPKDYQAATHRFDIDPATIAWCSLRARPAKSRGILWMPKGRPNQATRSIRARTGHHYSIPFWVDGYAAFASTPATQQRRDDV